MTTPMDNMIGKLIKLMPKPLDAPAYYVSRSKELTDEELANFGKAWASMCETVGLQPLIVVPEGVQLNKLTDSVLDEIITYLGKEQARRAVELPRVKATMEPVSTWDVMQEWMKHQTPLLYTVEAGMLPEIAYVPTSEVEERVQHFRETGRVLIDEMEQCGDRLHLMQREVLADTLTVTEVKDYLVKMPILRDLATGELFEEKVQDFGS